MDEIELKDHIAALLPGVPKPVQDFILNQLGDFSLQMLTEYALHLDQADILEQELLLMLLGQESPSDFSKALQESGIPAEDVKSILTDVNNQVFKKLQKMELTDTAVSIISGKTTPREPALSTMKIEASPRPEPKPEPIPPYNLIRSDDSVPTPQVRTMQQDMERLQHPELQSDIAHVSRVPHPSQITPARSFQTASVPYSMNRIAPQPVPSKPIEPPRLPVQPMPSVESNQKTLPNSGDPYREPIA